MSFRNDASLNDKNTLAYSFELTFEYWKGRRTAKTIHADSTIQFMVDYNKTVD